MTDYILFYFLGAAYFSGIGSAVAVFSLFMRAADGKHQSASCFVRLMTLFCFAVAAYLLLTGLWQIAP